MAAPFFGWPFIVAAIVAIACAGGRAAAADAVRVNVARQGVAQFSIIVSPQASQASETAADELADYLGRISGGVFAVEQGDGTRGLAVGAFDEFPALNLAPLFDPLDPFRREEYVLRSHAGGVYLVGATPAAARLAVWDLLHRLGHRQFFPTDHWEIIPSLPDIVVAVDVVDRPDYYARRIYPGGSLWAYGEPLWENWRVRNRNHSQESFDLRTGHVYGNIIRANQEAFDQNPEYYALVDGERRYRGGNTKFCISNDGLRKLVVDHAVRVMQANPEQQSISMDPSDGGNWCECQPCADMGSVSDRVVTLANEVAAAINELELGVKYVGMYAYAHHSPPPNISIHPKVVVSTATSFIRGGYTAEELVEQWSAKGAIIGIREYYAISTWSHDRPGHARAAQLDYLSRTVRYFHEHGARFNIANASHSWGAYGLGFYMLAQMLWDVEQTGHVDELFDDFLERGFGPARKPIERYHRLIYRFDENTPLPLLSEHLIGSMYRYLAEARELAGDTDPGLTARINDLVLYTRYVELYHQAQSASGAEQQALGEALLRHIHAMHKSMLVVYWHRSDPRRLPMPRENVPQGEALEAIQTIDAYSPGEIDQMLAQGIAHNELLSFEPITFSRDLVPAAAALRLSEQRPGSFGSHAPRGRQVFYLWLNEPGTITLRVRGGMIAQYRNRGNVRITLHSPLDELGEGIAFDDSVPPDGEEHTVTLTTPFAGLHWVEALDGGDSTFVSPADELLPYTILAEQGEPFTYRGRWTLYFYVPHGTQTVAGYASSPVGRMRDAEGNVIFQFDQMQEAGHFNVPVPPGQDGRLWRMESCSGQRYLMTVPPSLAALPQHLLLPREVVEADARQKVGPSH